MCDPRLAPLLVDHGFAYPTGYDVVKMLANRLANGMIGNDGALAGVELSALFLAQTNNGGESRGEQFVRV